MILLLSGCHSLERDGTKERVDYKSRQSGAPRAMHDSLSASPCPHASLTTSPHRSQVWLLGKGGERDSPAAVARTAAAPAAAAAAAPVDGAAPRSARKRHTNPPSRCTLRLLLLTDSDTVLSKNVQSCMRFEVAIRRHFVGLERSGPALKRYRSK